MDGEPIPKTAEFMSPYERGKGLPHGETITSIGNIDIVLPENPWMGTHTGVELEVINKRAEPLATNTKDLTTELLEVGKTAVIAAEVGGAFSEVDNPRDNNSSAWYDKPWVNLNINSDLAGDSFPNLTMQVYLRPRTLGQAQLKTRDEITRNILKARERAKGVEDEELAKGIKVEQESQGWTHPMHTIPIPVDEPLNPYDRVPYDENIQKKAKTALGENFQGRIAKKIQNVKLFTDENGNNTLKTTYDFKTGKGNYVVWQCGDYMLVTQDTPLVDRKHGVHLVLIGRGEQQRSLDPSLDQGYSFLWRNPRLVAEMAVIAAAISKIVTTYGYAGSEFDRSYDHLNSNWSLGPATPDEEQKEIGGYPTLTKPGADPQHPTDFPSRAPGKWPGPEVLSPNAHFHIQIIKKDTQKQKHQLDLAFSGPMHNRKNTDRQTDNEISALNNLLNEKLTPVINNLQGKTLV